MEFNINRDLFVVGIQKTLGIVEKKTTLPILSNLLLRAGQNRVTIIATDREIGLLADYDAEIIHEGEITLSARKLHEMVREIQGNMIHVVRNEKNVVVMTCNKAVYRIPGIPADDYPMVTDHGDTEFRKIKGGSLKELIRKTSFAVSTDEMRKNLCGVLMETEKTENALLIRMVATDGHRLAMMKMDAGSDGFSMMEKGVIIPRKGLVEMRRLFEDAPGDVMIGFRQGKCIVRTDHTMLSVSLVDAEFPDYRRVIPSEKGLLVTVDKDKFLHALRRMAVISSDRYNGVIMTLAPGKVVLNSTDPSVGDLEANDEIDVAYEGESRSVGYNVTYLTEAIEVVDESEVEFEIGEGMKPGIVRAIGNENYFCIVMPLKL